MSETHTEAAPQAWPDRFIQAVARRASTRYRRDAHRGILTIDFLLGAALAAIVYFAATGMISDWRVRGYAMNTQSDASSVGQSLESFFTDNGSYPADLAAVKAAVADGSLGVALSPGDTIDYFGNAGGENMQFCVQHTAGTVKDAYSIYVSSPDAVFSHNGVVASAKDPKGSISCPTAASAY